MSTISTHPDSTFEARADERFRELSSNIASRIKAIMGDLTQKALAQRLGKGSSTVSRDLRGDANLSLRTILTYQEALDESIISVPREEQSGRRRRRRRPDEGWEKPKGPHGDDSDPVTRQLHRLLTRVSRRLSHLLQKQNEMTQSDLAKRLDKSPSYVSRVLGGGVNLTLETISEFEVALGGCILHVEGQQRKGAFTGKREASGYVDPYRSSNDGCYLDDHGGRTSTGMTKWLETKDEDCVSDEPEMMVA